jgi:hypothetical protein
MPFVGIGVGIGRQRFGGGGGFDADYQAVLNYATTQGYTLPSAGQQILQNQLVIDLKNAGIWSKLDTFAVFATDGDSDFALIDWKRLSDYTAVNSPTFTTNQGFTGNAIDQTINTNIQMNTQLVQYKRNDAFACIYLFNVVNTNYFFGSQASTGSLQLVNGGSTRMNSSGFIFPSPSFLTSEKYRGLRRNIIGNFDFITTNNVSNATLNSDGLNASSVSLLGRTNSNGWNASTASMYIMGSYLDNTEFSNLKLAFDTYINAL